MKVGDRVRCVRNDDNEEFYSIGAEGPIWEIDDDGYVWVAFDTGDYDHSFGARPAWCGHPSWFEVIE